MAEAARLRLEGIRQRAVATVLAAADEANPDRELVTRAFNQQLEALGLPSRPVIFHASLNAALRRIYELAIARLPRDLAWYVSWAASEDAKTNPADTRRERIRRVTVRNVGWTAAGADDSFDFLIRVCCNQRRSSWTAAGLDNNIDAAWAAAREVSGNDDAATDALFAATRAAVANAVTDADWEVTWWAARVAAWDPARATWLTAWAAAEDAAREAVWSTAWDGAWSASRHDGWNAVAAAAWVGAAESGWNAFWVATRVIANEEQRKELTSVMARSCLDIVRGGGFAFWVAPDAVHIVLVQLRTLNGRLHCEHGTAVAYEDGSGLYYWKGIRVPEHVILAPERLGARMILQERNAAVRRAMIERYGLDRFVLEAGAKRLDKRRDNELLAIDLPDDPDHRLVVLKLRCPSTSAVYILRVPPGYTSVRDALAWSFGLDQPEDYVLQQES